MRKSVEMDTETAKYYTLRFDCKAKFVSLFPVKKKET